MDPRASGGVHITRDLLGLWQLELAAVGATFASRSTPPPRLVTDNLDNFGNRGDSHRLSILQPHKMRLHSLFLLLRRSPAEVIAVTEVIGYRSQPKKRATSVDSKVSDLRSSTQC